MSDDATATADEHRPRWELAAEDIRQRSQDSPTVAAVERVMTAAAFRVLLLTSAAAANAYWLIAGPPVMRVFAVVTTFTLALMAFCSRIRRGGSAT